MQENRQKRDAWQWHHIGGNGAERDYYITSFTSNLEQKPIGVLPESSVHVNLSRIFSFIAFL